MKCPISINSNGKLTDCKMKVCISVNGACVGHTYMPMWIDLPIETIQNLLLKAK